MKRALTVLAFCLVAAAVYWQVRGEDGDQAASFRLVAVARGDLASVVTSTGTLEPVTTVQVGTQVSGIVDEILTDFNDRVAAGQVIARIDTTLLAAAVASAEAQLDRATAELRQAEREFARTEPLFREEMISASEFNGVQYGLDVARAGLKGARVDLDRARRNLAYATITAPIAGTVVRRSVDVGQTVQSSFSAPELFQIAGDLTEMQILAAVDESDIGRIREGQATRFTVQAYPDDTFQGTVRQLRLQSVVDDNVVNYQVVVRVENPGMRLLPGMTATVDFIVDEATDVLFAPNAALRFRPSQEEMAAAFARRRAERGRGPGEEGTTGPRGQGADSGPGGQGGQPGGTMPADRGMLWVTREDGTLDVVMVRTGITDGTNTAVEGRDLVEGLEVIAGVASKAAAAASSPFQQQGRPSGPPRPGGF
ncbi:MAG: efflux RND transporter periplasmic adaptor subunit [Candidatus Krumholzibacteriia bacterium]